MKVGPKADVATERPLPTAERPPRGPERAVWFMELLPVPKGVGARKRLRVRDFQRTLIEGVLTEPRPRSALWAMPRGNGKSTLAAALGLYGLYMDDEIGASVVVVARDERQARIVWNTAVRMVERVPVLVDRSQLFQDRIWVPGSGSEFRLLPAEAKSLEGLDPSLAVVDEIGVVDRRVYEVMAASMGKRPESLLLMIGTPSPDGADSVMYELRQHALEHDDPSFHSAEFGAKDTTHPVDCEHCWEEANPALDDCLARDAMAALLPPKLREATYRRARLGQWVDDLDEPWMPPGAWDACAGARRRRARRARPRRVLQPGRDRPDRLHRRADAAHLRRGDLGAQGRRRASRSSARPTTASPSATSSRRSATRAAAGASWRSSVTRTAGSGAWRRLPPRASR